jgi:Tfp pilus assembly protein PilO
MNWLPKDKKKRQQLAFVLVGVVAVLGAIWFFVIRPQNDTMRKIITKEQDAQNQLQAIKNTDKQSDAVAQELTDVSNTLALAQADMASGDIYAWTYNTIRQFKSAYKVEIPEISQPVLSDEDLLPDFPYRQLKVVVSGTAYYQDFGKFVADLENRFPHMRVANLTLEPAGKGDDEKLSFRMDIIALVKPNAS